MRILALTHAGTNSRDIMLDFCAGFESAGHECMRLELGALPQPRSAEDRPRAALDAARLVESLVKANRVDFTVAMWYNAVFSLPVVGPQRETFFDASGIPHVAFWLDAPQWAHDRGMWSHFATPLVGGPRVLHLVNSASAAREMREVMGFGPTLAQPYGVDLDAFRPSPGAAPEYDLVMGLGAGDPEPTEHMLAELERDDPDVESIRAERIAAAQRKMMKVVGGLAESARPGVEEVVTRWCASQLRARDEPALSRLRAIGTSDPSLRAATMLVLRTPALYVDLSDRLRRAEQWERAFVLTYLSRRLGTAVFGGGELRGWPLRAVRLGELPYREQCRAYARGRLGLNVMRWQDDHGVNIKPLEIGASGRACLMHRREGIAELLEPGREIAVFDSPCDALNEASRLLASPGACEAMGEAALARVRREHTWAARCARLCAAVGEMASLRANAA